MIAPLIQTANMVDPFLQRMIGKPFQSRVRSRVIAIKDASIVIGPEYLVDDTQATEEVAADLVVLVTPNRSNREIYEDLSDSGRDVRIIGDAKAPRFLETAIREGHLAGAAVGSS